MTWRFYRISVIMEYEKKPTLPPPFAIITHLWLFGRFVKSVTYDKRKSNRRNKSINNTTDRGNSEEVLNCLHVYILLVLILSSCTCYVRFNAIIFSG